MLPALLKAITRLAKRREPGSPSRNAPVGDSLVAHELQRAKVFATRGDLAAAKEVYEKVLSRDAHCHAALVGIGIVHARKHEYADAASVLERAVERQPAAVDAINALANVYQLQRRFDDAEKLYRGALLAAPDDPMLWVNLGLCLLDAGQQTAARIALRRAIEIAPDHAGVLLNIGMSAIDLGERDEAERCLRRALDINPALAEAHTGLAHLLLQRGDFDAGWRHYEWRFRCEDAELHQPYPIPEWDGRSIAKQTLLVRAEQGVGDQIMMASCLPDAMERVGACIVECHPYLVPLFARAYARARVYPYRRKQRAEWAVETPQPDFQVHIGSLPRLLRRRPSDFPAHSGYLSADPARVAHWRRKLDDLGPRVKIGISWRGGAPRTRQTLRSVALDEWLPVLRCANAAFVSLQYGDCTAELARTQRKSGVVIHHWQDAIDDYDETAALITALDQVISVQTAVVHLAGALAIPTWALVPAVPEWRYMASGDAMPWYPAVTILRQQRRGIWGPVMDDVAAKVVGL